MLMPATCASCGLRRCASCPAMRMDPASRGYTPLRIFISVLLPAPFSPTSACTSPGHAVKSTFWSTGVPPKDFEIPVISSSGSGIDLLQVLLDRRTEQLLNRGLLHIRGGHHGGAGIDAPLRRLAVQLIDQRLHRGVTHAERILHHQRIQIAGLHVLDHRGRAVEPDDLELPRHALALCRLDR